MNKIMRKFKIEKNTIKCNRNKYNYLEDVFWGKIKLRILFLGTI